MGDGEKKASKLDVLVGKAEDEVEAIRNGIDAVNLKMVIPDNKEKDIKKT